MIMTDRISNVIIRSSFAVLIFLFILTSCGSENNSKKVKQNNDSIESSDSLEKRITETESYDLLNLAIQNEDGFNHKYGNKKLRIKNLVVEDISKYGNELQCLAYSPSDSLLSHTSQKGDLSKNVAEYRDFVNDIPCKTNPDFTYYFDLFFAETANTAGIKAMKLKEEKLLKKSYFYSVITIEGESITFSDNIFSLKNCRIINTK